MADTPAPLDVTAFGDPSADAFGVVAEEAGVAVDVFGRDFVLDEGVGVIVEAPEHTAANVDAGGGFGERCSPQRQPSMSPSCTSRVPAPFEE